MINYTTSKIEICLQITPNSSLKTEGSDSYAYFRSRHFILWNFKKRMPLLMVFPLHSMQYSHEPDFFTQHIGIGNVTGMLSVTSPKPKPFLESLVTLANTRRSEWTPWILSTCDVSIIVIFMHFVFIYVSWCQTRFPYNTMFVSYNSNMTGVTCGTGTAYRSETLQCTPGF
jgi:hypothetical protein